MSIIKYPPKWANVNQIKNLLNEQVIIFRKDNLMRNISPKKKSDTDNFYRVPELF